MNADNGLDPLVATLRALEAGTPDTGRWEPMAPAGDARLLARIEARAGVRLPEDLRSVLISFGGGTLLGPGESILIVGPIGDLASLNPDPVYAERLPGMFILGNDGGGDLYFCDPANRLGHGPCALFIVAMGEASLAASRPVAATFTAACNAIVSGADFFARDPLGKGDGR